MIGIRRMGETQLAHGNGYLDNGFWPLVASTPIPPYSWCDLFGGRWHRTSRGQAPVGGREPEDRGPRPGDRITPGPEIGIIERTILRLAGRDPSGIQHELNRAYRELQSIEDAYFPS
jgi:hypothetical protein